MQLKELTLPNQAETRLTVQYRGKETVRADIPALASTITVYWHGRVHLSTLFSFFLEACPPPTSKREFGLLVFLPNARIRDSGLTTIMALERQIPTNASFVRLEHTSGDSPGPDLIVWSRVDLADVPVKQPAPDYIGVAGPRDWLDSIRCPLAEFVSTTHVGNMVRKTALDSVSRILHYQLSHSHP